MGLGWSVWCATPFCFENDMAQVVVGYEVPRAEPVIVAVDGQEPANSAAAAAAREENNYNCGVPPNVSKSVKAVSVILLQSGNYT